MIHAAEATPTCEAPTVLRGDPAVLRHSAGATGTCALLAVLDAMGLVAGDQTFTHESVIGTVLKARVLSRHTSDDVPQIVPMVEASAWVTADISLKSTRKIR